MQRRDIIKTALAAGVSPLIGGCEGPRSAGTSPRPLPALFVAHGSPMLIDDATWVRELRAWTEAIPRPSSILVISAHWVDRPITLSATQPVPVVHDFYGFPSRYYEMAYPAPGAPALARRVRELLAPTGPVVEDPKRGLDHGAYVPLMAMVPGADIPVLQMSLPGMDPAELVEVGRRLAPLRSEGVLIVGSGFLTHNMRAIDFRSGASVPSWAAEFDAWAAEALGRRDVDGLVAYRDKAPGVRIALPTHEHFVPVLMALGTSVESREETTFPIIGWTYGSFTKRSVQFG